MLPRRRGPQRAEGATRPARRRRDAAQRAEGATRPARRRRGATSAPKARAPSQPKARAARGEARRWTGPAAGVKTRAMTPPAPDPADLRRSTAEDVAAAWVGRARAVVWHGFTQMAAYPALSPVIVERAENRDLIDVAGQRFLDGISSLWVTTLGHRTAELDAAVRRQLDRVAHSTLLGNGSRVVVELAEALAAVVPVDGPHVLFASDGASAVEQALKVVFQHHVNRGEPQRRLHMALGNAYHGDTIGSLSLGDGGFGTELYDELVFRWCARRATRTRAGWARRSPPSRHTPASWRAG